MTRVARGAAAALVTVVLLVLAGFLGTAWLHHWTFHIVETGSMAPAIPKDSVAAVTPVNGRDIAVGDVISFAFADQPEATIVHRVVERIDQADAVFFRTKGDANAEPDLRLIPASAVEGEVTFDLRGAGVVARQLHPPWTWLLLVGGPLALLLFGELRRVRRQHAEPEAQRLAGDRAWLPPFSSTYVRVAEPAHPPAGRSPGLQRSPGGDPVAHHAQEDT